MKYSVIVPCYNADKTLEKAIDSIQQSGLSDFEIFLVDDGSKDDTPALCDRLAQENSNIRVVHQKNAGYSGARNRGIEEAEGDYIWFFDSDDLVDAGSMKRAAKIVEEQEPDMLMFGMSFDYYAGKRLYQRLELYYDEERFITSAQISKVFSELYRNNMLTPSWNKLFRREFLIDHGIRFHSKLFVMEDFHFSLMVMKYCASVYTLPQVIYRYRQYDFPEDNRAAKRVNRISDLPAYMIHFESVLSDYPDVFTKVFFMLLRQKLSIQSQSEMAETARTVCGSAFDEGKYAIYETDSERNLLMMLKNGRFKELVQQNRKSSHRHRLVTLLKKSRVYAFLKGPIVRRVSW